MSEPGNSTSDSFQSFNSNELITVFFQGGGSTQTIAGVIDSPSGGPISWGDVGNPFTADNDCRAPTQDPKNLHFTCQNGASLHGGSPLSLVTGSNTMWRITVAGVDPDQKVGPAVALCGHGFSIDSCPGPAPL